MHTCFVTVIPEWLGIEGAIVDITMIEVAKSVFIYLNSFYSRYVDALCTS